MIMPLPEICASLHKAYCCRCNISWFCFNPNMEGNTVNGIIECSRCLRCVFFDLYWEDSYLKSVAFPRPINWLGDFLPSLPECLCGGRFQIDSPHHDVMEWHSGEYADCPKWPICNHGHSSLQNFYKDERGTMEFGIWVPYMNRLYGAGPNNGYGEPIPEVTKHFDWNYPEIKKPRFLVGLGLIDGKMTEAF